MWIGTNCMFHILQVSALTHCSVIPFMIGLSKVSHKKSHLLSETKQCSNILLKSSFLTHKDQVGCLNVYIQCTTWWWWGCHPTVPRIVDIIDEVISPNHKGHVKVIHNSYAGVLQSGHHGSKLHWILYLVSLTHYLELRVAITIIVYLIFPQWMPNQLFEHYKALTSLHGNKFTLIVEGYGNV